MIVIHLFGLLYTDAQYLMGNGKYLNSYPSIGSIILFNSAPGRMLGVVSRWTNGGVTFDKIILCDAR